MAIDSSWRVSHPVHRRDLIHSQPARTTMFFMSNRHFSARGRNRSGRHYRQRGGRDDFLTTALTLCAFVALITWTIAPNIISAWTVGTNSPEAVADIEGSVYYPDCAAARAAGAAPMHRGSPGYRDHLDGDNDGTACEPYHRW
ncbi:excalibur calcium-binding domain-containing protein [Stakelama saccharophila]|uniref:Excalibur calcium-binding domain-containing protein n=1 Tax=Stakelama saccharophila TaxID=3075605 RepID=A0ABZ0B8C5_9SPHN|nr:excalibur calcium-binding domain-containing protein [Stakelama sp. W311]WNO53638.1 excalibur calcium-binding domain-containing protein [Stakelama sp. W311]